MTTFIDPQCGCIRTASSTRRIKPDIRDEFNHPVEKLQNSLSLDCAMKCICFFPEVPIWNVLRILVRNLS